MSLPQNAQEATAAAAAAAVVREAAAAAVVDVLEGESQEERASRLAAAKESRMRKVIRCGQSNAREHLICVCSNSDDARLHSLQGAVGTGKAAAA